jgi:guanine deaminase
VKKTIAYRGSIFYFKDSATMANLPKRKQEGLGNNYKNSHYIYLEDGLLIVEDGKIKAVGDYQDLIKKFKEIEIKDYQKKLITPGFIDTHQHACQSSIVAAYGEKLLEWLHDYVFPSESEYADEDYARKNLSFFLDEVIKNGTTTAVSYGPLFYNAADIYFEELAKRNMRFITGNILMDSQNSILKLSTQENYDNMKKLISQWHHKNRLSFCISPRFALACSPELLELCGALKKEHNDLYIQTHLGENKSEVEEVKKAYPWSKNYMDVYDHYGLVTDKTIFGHCVHITESELALFRRSKAIIATCPLSNNFLGSGLFDFGRAAKYTDRITFGTDWGGGDSLSMLAVMDDVYKAAMLNSYKIPSMVRWYLCTLGAAQSLGLDEKIGNFSPGKEADFIVIDLDATAYLHYRLTTACDIFETLFVLMTIGDSSSIVATYIYGKELYRAMPSPQEGARGGQSSEGQLTGMRFGGGKSR